MTRQKAYQPQRGSNMQNGGFRRTMLRLMTVVGVLVGALTILGCPGGEEEVEEEGRVFRDNTSINVNTTTIRALEGQTFTFLSAAISPVLANQQIAVTFTNTAAATPTATVTAPNVRGTDGQPASFTGITTFGSCIFRVTASTFLQGTGPQVGHTITVNPCRYVVQTAGMVANSQATTANILLQLGQTPSAIQQAQVAIDPVTGVVTVNNVNTGQTVGGLIVTD